MHNTKIDDTTALEQAALERKEAFRCNVLRYKFTNKMTDKEIAEECELTKNSIQSYLSKRSTLTFHNILKISMALGIGI